MLGSRDRHIHAPVVAEETYPTCSHCRYDYDVLLSALVSVHSVNFDVGAGGQTQLILHILNG